MVCLFLGKVNGKYRHSFNGSAVFPHAAIVELHGDDAENGEPRFLMARLRQLFQSLDMTEIDDEALAFARRQVHDEAVVVSDLFTGAGPERNFEANRFNRRPGVGAELDGIETVDFRFLRGGDEYGGLKMNARGECDLLTEKERDLRKYNQQHQRGGCYDAHAPNLSQMSWVI